MKLKGIALAAAGIWSLATVPLAAAQMVEARNPASVMQALTDAKYVAELKKDTQGDPMIIAESSGMKFVILFFGCKNNVDCKSVSFFSAYRAQNKVTPDAVNAWNRDHRFGRVYLDNEGDPAIQFDVDLDDGGMTPALFIDNFEWFTVAVVALRGGLK
jgi:hypothetical protein